MAVTSIFAQKVLGLLGAFGLRWLRSTIDWRVVYADVMDDPVYSGFGRQTIYVCWHEAVLTPLVLRPHRNQLGLASQHGDADIISRAIRHLGWSVVRGSTTRGGLGALLKMLRDEKRNPCFTTDGPRGPRRRMSTGPIFLASKLGAPVVCFGCGYHHPLRLRSWDRFAIPRPFSRARILFGPRLRVPPNLDRDGLESYRLWFDRLLNWLTDQAESWAESGRRRRGELPMLPGARLPNVTKWNLADALRLPDWLDRSWIALGNHSISKSCHRVLNDDVAA